MTERVRDRETWCFTPRQPLWLYQGEERETETESLFVKMSNLKDSTQMYTDQAQII